MSHASNTILNVHYCNLYWFRIDVISVCKRFKGFDVVWIFIKKFVFFFIFFKYDVAKILFENVK